MLTPAGRDVHDGVGTLRAADRGLAFGEALLARLLAVAREAGGAPDAAARACRQDEIERLRAAVEDAAASTTWRGEPLLDGSRPPRDVRVGPAGAERVTLWTGDLRPAALGDGPGRSLADVDARTAAGARQAIEIAALALDQVRTLRAFVGLLELRLQRAAEATGAAGAGAQRESSPPRW